MIREMTDDDYESLYMGTLLDTVDVAARLVRAGVPPEAVRERELEKAWWALEVRGDWARDAEILLGLVRGDG
jgi:hypothetical protein